jgi:hypothetical protein
MAATYCHESTRAVKEQVHDEGNFSGFYRYLYDSRCRLNDAEWADFRRELSSNIETSCDKLRKEKIPELHAVSMAPPSRDSTATIFKTNHTDGDSFSSSFASSGSSSSSSYSPVSSDQRSSVDTTRAANGVEQSQQMLQPLANPAAGPDAGVAFYRYTSLLKEHADAHGETVDYVPSRVSLYPPSYHSKATYNEFCGEGMARSSKLAKHAASKQLCDLMGLRVK